MGQQEIEPFVTPAVSLEVISVFAPVRVYWRQLESLLKLKNEGRIYPQTPKYCFA
jgi:hypothetical protein